jgi:FixJ family two-component response regulator
VPDQAHICIVDDDESFREAITSLVALMGYDVDSYKSAEEFLECGAAKQAACLITDIQMPGMGGIELHRRLVASGSPIPVIFVTAFPDDATRQRALRDGAIGYLGKPMQEAALVYCLERAVGHR